MMAKLKLNYFCLLAKFLFFNLKLLGLAPYNFDNKTRKLRTDCKSYIHLIVSVIIWLAFFGLRILHFQSPKVDSGLKSTILDQLWQILFLIQYFFACITIIYNFLKQHHVEKLLGLIFKFDDSLARLRWSRPNANSEISIFVVFIASTLFIAVYSVITFTLDVGLYETFEYIRMISFFSLHQFYLMLSMQFILSCYCILTRLKVLLNMFW